MVETNLSERCHCDEEVTPHDHRYDTDRFGRGRCAQQPSPAGIGEGCRGRAAGDPARRPRPGADLLPRDADALGLPVLLLVPAAVGDPDALVHLVGLPRNSKSPPKCRKPKGQAMSARAKSSGIHAPKARLATTTHPNAVSGGEEGQ